MSIIYVATNCCTDKCGELRSGFCRTIRVVVKNQFAESSVVMLCSHTILREVEKVVLCPPSLPPPKRKKITIWHCTVLVTVEGYKIRTYQICKAHEW